VVHIGISTDLHEIWSSPFTFLKSDEPIRNPVDGEIPLIFKICHHCSIHCSRKRRSKPFHIRHTVLLDVDSEFSKYGRGRIHWRWMLKPPKFKLQAFDAVQH
jgi:hypothetical protein